MHKTVNLSLKALLFPFLILFLAIPLFLNNPLSSHKAGRDLKLPSTLGDLQTFYYAWLARQEKSLWYIIENNYDIKKEECKKIAISLKDPNDPCHSLSRPMVEIAQSILSDFKLENIRVCGADPESSLARASKNSLYINEVKMEDYSIKAKKFFIGHEGCHIRNQDASMLTALEYLFEKKNNIKRDHNPTNPINQMSRFFELRADIEAAIHSPVYSQGFLEGMETFIQQGRLGAGISHPTVATRQKVSLNILAAHQTISNSQRV